MTPEPPTLDKPPQTRDNLVEVRGVHFTIGSRVIYKAVDLDIARGRITAIMGPSGTGKTTLLRLISGQWRPAQGTVHFDGAHVARLSQNDLFEQRKRMGMLFQSGALLTDLSVFDNVAFPLREHTKKSESEIRSIVMEKMDLDMVGVKIVAEWFRGAKYDTAQYRGVSHKCVRIVNTNQILIGV